ncbi:MAG: M48 family metalloprotease [Kiritimatiellaeota bacterium]|nr:M48 family metalloprotease [Kiritimatiellota bacterium]
MNFWKEKRVMEARSRLVFVCFIVVVTLCVFAPYFFVHAAVASGKIIYHNREGFPPCSAFIGPVADGWRFWRYPYFPAVAILVLTPVLWGAARLFAKLRKGGSAVADMMDAAPISYSTRDFHDKRLLNVVEEMSIASGVQMPGVYVLADEPGINAVTAGFSSNDAVICVTRGASELLKRDELQGVIAHEFSHILNGDMFLHTLTLGLMHGFFVSRKLKSGLDVSGGSSGYFLRDMIMLVVQLLSMILLIPLWLWMYDMIFGGIGKMVKALFFRKREYLADANAVRFTRYPAGLAGVMKKIMATPAIQSIRAAGGEEANHLFFNEPLASPFSFLVAAHPPVGNRIKKIEPDFDGKVEDVDVPALREEIRELRETPRNNINVSSPLQIFKGESRNSRKTVLASLMENAEFSCLVATAENREGLSKHIDKVVSSSDTAQAYVFSLLLDDDSKSKVSAYQMASLADAYSAKFAETVESTRVISKKIPVDLAVISLERCVVSLRALSKTEYDKFTNTCKTLVLVDDEITLLEYSITAFVRRRLDHCFGFVERHPILRSDLRDCSPDAELLISILSWAGADSESLAEKAFSAALTELPEDIADGMSPRSLKPFDPESVNRSVSTLASVKAEDKETLFSACLAAVGSDDEVTRAEYEILRLFAMMIDCPLPRFSRGFSGISAFQPRGYKNKCEETDSSDGGILNAYRADE